MASPWNGPSSSLRRQHRVRPDDRQQRRLGGQRRHVLGLGGEQRAHVIGVAADDRAAVDAGLHVEDLAELAPRAEHELDLALREAHHLQRSRQRDRGRRVQGVARLGRSGRRGGGAAHVHHRAPFDSWVIARPSTRRGQPLTRLWDV
jgi:hypothetical protein